MKLKKLSYKYIVFFSLIILSFFALSSSLYAKVMTPTGVLNGTVRINICGDYIAEGSEECDRDDLKSLTCNNYGYALGKLNCNLVCEINTNNCYNEITEEQEEEIPETTVIPETNLPTAAQFLALFDEDGDGIINANEIPALIVNWINLWKSGGKAGDLNNDGESNLYDFSLLMYHLNISN